MSDKQDQLVTVALQDLKTARALARARQRDEVLSKLEKMADSSVPLKIPEIPGIGIMPNVFALSSAFVPISRKTKRRYLMDEELVHFWSSCRVFYTGVQLDESDRDVLIALFVLARRHPFGSTFTVKRRQLLSLIYPHSKAFGTSDYKWLKASLTRLGASLITYELKIKEETYSIQVRILKECVQVEPSGYLAIKMDPRIVPLFGNNQYILFDLEKRSRLSVSLAKSMEQLIGTAKETNQKFRLEWLAEKHDYHMPAHKVRAKFVLACEDLMKVGLISNYKWEEDTAGQWWLHLTKNLLKIACEETKD